MARKIITEPEAKKLLDKGKARLVGYEKNNGSILVILDRTRQVIVYCK